MFLPKKRSHVFVIGFPRSGTTLLKRLIESHSAFVINQKNSPDGSMFYTPETHLFSLVYQNRLATEPWDENIVQFFNDPEAFRKYKNSIKNRLFFQKYFLRKIFRYRYFTALLNRTGSHAGSHFFRLLYYVASMNKAVVERFFYHASVARGGQRIIEKTPYHYEFVSEILYSFAAAKIIFISRHPVDVYSSFRKRAQADKTWPDISVAAFCQRYRACYESISWHLKRKPIHILSIQYEQLVENPETAFKMVCAFIGEDFEASCLAGDKSLKGPEWDPHVHKDIVKQTKSWKDYMTADEAEEIEILLCDILSTYQYERYTKSR
jgi:hypothetical protein